MRATAIAHSYDVFAANRAVGGVALRVAASGGATRRVRVHEHGSLRVRLPRRADGVLDAVIVNTAGGMAGGDAFEVDIAAGCDARLALTTAAAEKVYRSLGPQTEIGVRLAVEPGGGLAWVPQETILFDRSRMRRSIDVALTGNAAVLLAEAIVFGRSAMNETVAEGSVFDRWRVRRDGILVFAETVRLDGAITQRLREPAIANGGIAIASVFKAPGDEAHVAALRTLRPEFCGEVAASAWNGFALARLCARDGAALRHDLIAVLTAWSDMALPRLWFN